MAIQRYAGDTLVGLSTDTKPLNVLDGARFFEIDAEAGTVKIYTKVNGTWVASGNYQWKLHSPDQIIGYLDEPANLVINVDGAGEILESVAAGDFVVTAVNEAGETLASEVPAFDILDDTTETTISWDAVEGASAYRVYSIGDGEFLEITETSFDYFSFTPDTEGSPPVENTAAIYQNPFIIANDDTVMVIGEGIDVETAIDELDTTKKILLLKKQRTDWNATGPNGIDNKPTIPAPTVNTDEKVKFDAADPTAGYLSEKIIQGENITIAEGTGENKNKLVISATASTGLWTRNATDGNIYPSTITDKVSIGINSPSVTSYMMNVFGGTNSGAIYANTTKSNQTAIYGGATDGAGVLGVSSTSGSGVYGTSNTGAGVTGQGGTGGSFYGTNTGVYGTSGSSPGKFLNTTATTNTIVETLILGSTNHAVAVGFGLVVKFSPPKPNGGSGGLSNYGQFGWVYTDVTTAAEKGDFYWSLIADGVLTERMRLSDTGDLQIDGSLTESSSKRWKRKIKTFGGAINIIKKLRGVRFIWDKAHGGKQDIGLIAEEVAVVVPELVKTDKGGLPAGVKYTKLTAILVEAVKDQQNQIEALKTELIQLKKLLNKL